MCDESKLEKIEDVLCDKEKENVKHIKSDNSLFERVELSKKIITRDNKELMLD